MPFALHKGLFWLILGGGLAILGVTAWYSQQAREKEASEPEAVQRLRCPRCGAEAPSEPGDEKNEKLCEHCAPRKVKMELREESVQDAEEAPRNDNGWLLLLVLVAAAMLMIGIVHHRSEPVSEIADEEAVAWLTCPTCGHRRRQRQDREVRGGSCPACATPWEAPASETEPEGGASERDEDAELREWVDQVKAERLRRKRGR